MALRFVVFEGRTGPHDNRPFLVLERTHLPATRTGLLITQLAGLLLGRHFQGARQQGTHGRQRDVFHFGEVHVQPRALLAPMLPHDDFPPAFHQLLNALEIFRLQFTSSHVASLQRDPSISPDEILP